MRSRTTVPALAALVLALAALVGVAAARATHADLARVNPGAVRVERADLQTVSIQRPSAPVSARMSMAGPAPQKLWVFFTDKALTRDGERAAIDRAAAELSPRALWRRAKVGMVVNRNDVPVAASAMTETAFNHRGRGRSR
jgi:hypothetical protein